LFIHTVYKCLFLLVTTSGMGQFFGTRNINCWRKVWDY